MQLRVLVALEEGVWQLVELTVLGPPEKAEAAIKTNRCKHMETVAMVLTFLRTLGMVQTALLSSHILVKVVNV